MRSYNFGTKKPAIEKNLNDTVLSVQIKSVRMGTNTIVKIFRTLNKQLL